MDADTKSIIETRNAILARMVTTDKSEQPLAEMHESFACVRAKVGDIRIRIKAIDATLHGHHGFAKEIDCLTEHVAAIEKHLGMERAIEA